MKKILITGAHGFVGQNLYLALRRMGYCVRGSVRREVNDDLSVHGESIFVGDIGQDVDWEEALDKVEIVIHLAGRAHVLRETAKDPLAEFRRVNVAGTENLARAAALAKVRRFIFISSIGVNGKITRGIFQEEDQPKPHNAYADSKFEAEKILHHVAQETGIEVVILRPPLVYGPGVGANFLRLIQLVQKGIPLPFGSIKNQRSFIYVGNLVDAIITCFEHPCAAARTYLVSDDEKISTPGLIRNIADALGCPARVLPFSGALLRLLGRVTGKSEMMSRLLDSLVIDSSRIRSELDWTPPYSMARGLQETAKWYKNKNGLQ